MIDNDDDDDDNNDNDDDDDYGDHRMWTSQLSFKKYAFAENTPYLLTLICCDCHE